jgi:hypothetical protein
VKKYLLDTHVLLRFLLDDHPEWKTEPEGLSMMISTSLM